jgi:hypothetical protein
MSRREKHEMSSELRVRVIYYDTISWAEARNLGIPSREPSQFSEEPGEIALLRCTNSRGARVTVVCTADRLQELFDSGMVKDPQGLLVTDKLFLVGWRGWGARVDKNLMAASR